MQTTRVPFTVHSFHADAAGLLTAPALAGYLQEAAGMSADALGFGLAALNRQGLTWVMTRERVELLAPLCWRDTLEVETWPSGLDRVAALRDFRLWRRGVLVGRVVTTWLALDLETRRPVRPARVLPEGFQFPADHVLPLDVPPVPALETPEVERRFPVRFADMDANRHVTNASYITWALEALDEDTWRQRWMTSLDVQFLAECHLGCHVLSRSARAGGDSRVHSMVREADGKELARARTTWAPRA